MAPRHLSSADQAYSDRATTAVSLANPDRRAWAWGIVARLRGQLAEPGDGDLERRLEATVLWGAALTVAHYENTSSESAILNVARRLRDVHHRHEAIVAERARAG